MASQKTPTVNGAKDDKVLKGTTRDKKRGEDDLPDMDTMMNDLGSLVNKHTLGGKTNVTSIEP